MEIQSNPLASYEIHWDPFEIYWNSLGDYQNSEKINGNALESNDTQWIDSRALESIWYNELIGTHWNTLEFNEDHWHRMKSIGANLKYIWIHWNTQKIIGIHWGAFESYGINWESLQCIWIRCNTFDHCIPSESIWNHRHPFAFNEIHPGPFVIHWNSIEITINHRIHLKNLRN